MSTFLALRRFWRPDQPQPVYPLVVDATVRTWRPVFDVELGTARVRERPTLDVRGYDWSPEQGWLYPAVDGVTRTWSGVWSTELAGFRSQDGKRLELRRIDWDSDGWVSQGSVPAIVSTWISVFDAQPSFRTPARAPLELFGGTWSPEFGWIQKVVDPVVATYAPAVGSERVSYRSSAAAPLDVRRYEWAPEFGWIATPNPANPVTVAQSWPAVLEALSPGYRSATRATLDVRSYDWSPQSGWIANVVDPVVAKWAPAFVEERGSYRPRGQAALDVRVDWSPSLGWLSFFRVVVATQAQLWPGIAGPGGIRTETRARVEVRHVDGFPEIGWLFKETTLPRHAVRVIGVDVFVSGIPAGLSDVIMHGIAANLETGTKATGIAAGGNDTSGLTAGLDDAE